MRRTIATDFGGYSRVLGVVGPFDLCFLGVVECVSARTGAWPVKPGNSPVLARG